MVQQPVAAAQARLTRLRLRYPRLGRGVDAAVELARRDNAVGGSLLSAALAVRLFLWLLPWCLLLVAGLGFVGSRETLQDLARAAGMGPSIQALLGEVGSQAAPGRWAVGVTGVALLGWATLVLGNTAEKVRTGIRGAEPRPRPRTRVFRSLRYCTALGAVLLVYGAAGLARTAGLPWPVFVPVSMLALFALGSIMLGPARTRGWWRRGLTGDLVAGSALFAVGLEAMRLVGTVYLPPKFDRSSALYGTFGVTAAILVWLALSARLIVLAHLVEARRDHEG